MDIKPARKRQGIYKFITNKDLKFETHLFGYDFENPWLKINPDGLVIVKGTYHKGYAWDGCTPKWNFFDLFLIGTPDGRAIVNTQLPITYYASLIHDILLQFKNDIGLSRKEADEVFLKYLGNFSLRYVYFVAVRLFGMTLTLIELIKEKLAKR